MHYNHIVFNWFLGACADDFRRCRMLGEGLVSVKDKKLTINQVKGLVHEAYDRLEILSLIAAEETMREVFGIGPARFEKYKKRYLELFGEKAAEMSEGIIREARKRGQR